MEQCIDPATAPVLLKRKSLSIDEKMGIIARLQSGRNQTQVSKDLCIPRSTVQGVWSAREKIEDQFEKKKGSLRKVRKPDYDDIDQSLLEWFTLQRGRNARISGPMMRAKAEEFAVLLKHPGFKASSGWLDKWKDRHEVKFGAGKYVPRVEPSADTWLKGTWPEISAGYDRKDIFHADETGLFFKMMPEESFLFKGHRCQDGQHPTERFTVLLCCSRDGSEKLRPLVVGKHENPWCLSKMKDRCCLPVEYVSNKNAWMTYKIFNEWLKQLNQRMFQNSRNILLLLRSSTAHPQSVRLKHVNVVIVPTGVASALRSFHLEVKKIYRRLLVQKVVRHLDWQKVVKVDLMDSVLMLHSAWCHLGPTTIEGYFSRAMEEETKLNGFLEEEEPHHVKLSSVGILGTLAGNFAAFQCFDDDLVTEGMETEEDIASRVSAAPVLKQSYSDSEEEEEEPQEGCFPLLTTSQVLECIHNLKVWVVCQTDASDAVIDSLVNVEKFALAVEKRSAIC